MKKKLMTTLLLTGITASSFGADLDFRVTFKNNIHKRSTHATIYDPVAPAAYLMKLINYKESKTFHVHYKNIYDGGDLYFLLGKRCDLVINTRQFIHTFNKPSPRKITFEVYEDKEGQEACRISGLD